MAGRDQATRAKSAAFDIIDQQVGIRPGAVGVVPLGGNDFGLKVTLPRAPAAEPPLTVMDVPVEYWVGGRPRLLGAAMPSWRRKVMGGSG